MNSPTIGIIGGAGWLGRSLAKALLATGFVAPEALLLSSRSAPSPLAGVAMTCDNAELVRRSDVVVLSVRPQDLPAVQIEVGGKLLISLVAGASMHDLKAHVKGLRVVRAMPNAALEQRCAYTPWLASAEVDAPGKDFVQRLFQTCGQADEVFSEQQLNYLTGLSGTGPAYPALLAQALFNSALRQGLPEPIARRAVMGVVQASQLIGQPQPFQALLEVLIGYRGVTAAGLEAMRAAGFETLIEEGLACAAQVAGCALFSFEPAEFCEGRTAPVDRS
ncbi:pyrroline-5-carboxylate reductase family protein [Pseudomonas abieticivorans]|uniref:pyrroline-5-carboxylate reductase family protein n=1 Tax=Pseudomonas abieticivorans TaxID=2931382 RepID=UPI0020C0DD16|nr:pyrroline-5-carboxylate reductase dimerization domain-containing protein [Pseudomonas sp. PIA16]